MDSGAFSGPSSNTNHCYCDPNHRVTVTCEQAMVLDISKSPRPTLAYCPLSEVY